MTETKNGLVSIRRLVVERWRCMSHMVDFMFDVGMKTLNQILLDRQPSRTPPFKHLRKPLGGIVEASTNLQPDPADFTA